MKDCYLLEFEKLKDEQIGRLTYRDTLFYFTMTIIGGALAIACSDKDLHAFEILLVVPYCIFIAGVAHITCDRRIEDIGIYIRDELRPAIAESSDPEKVFAWERFFRHASFQAGRKMLQFVANEMLYALSGGAALFYFLLRKAQSANAHAIASPFKLEEWEMWMWWAGAALMAFMAVLIGVFTFIKMKNRKTKARKHPRAFAIVRSASAVCVMMVVGAVVWLAAKALPVTCLGLLPGETMPNAPAMSAAVLAAWVAAVSVWSFGRR